MEKKKYKKFLQMLIIIDDFADDPSFTRQSKMLHYVYVRGRHKYDIYNNGNSKMLSIQLFVLMLLSYVYID